MKTILVTLSIFSFWSFEIYAKDPSVCSYYLTKSSELGCSSENYLTQFGYKYCERFLQKEKLYSDHGKFVLNLIRNCLIDQLKIAEDLTCENVESAAHDMHFQCYIESGFCEMSWWDKNVTLWLVRREITSPAFLSTFLKINDFCLRD